MAEKDIRDIFGNCDNRDLLYSDFLDPQHSSGRANQRKGDANAEDIGRVFLQKESSWLVAQESGRGAGIFRVRSPASETSRNLRLSLVRPF